MPLPRLGGLTTTEQMPFLVFGKPDISHLEKEAVMEVLDSGWLSTGPWCSLFESEFKKYLGEGHPVAVSSCTDGLTIALMACGVGPGDEVITTPLTFAATVNAILNIGAMPVFVDVNSNGLINPVEILDAISSRTKAIVPVHYTGAPCDMDSILSIALQHGLFVVEDAAHAFGGVHPKTNKKIGTMGHYSAFSFYPTKNITCGEGGIVVAKTEAMADKIRTISLQGLSAGAHQRYGSGPVRPYRVVTQGIKGNLSDIHAAIGATQLRRWPVMNMSRSVVWTVYEEAFGTKPKGHSMHLFTVNVNDRDGLRQFLHKKGIGTGIHFNPLHLEPAYAPLGYKSGDFPKAETLGLTTLSLPVSSTMTVSDAERVVREVKEFTNTGR
jgi:dTDP-4-amino-4,6-dideoxygalactose transaminase